MNTKKYNSTKKSILIDKSYHKDLMRLCKEQNYTLKDFIQEAILFFKSTGLTPKDRGHSTSNLIKKLDKRIIGFILTQEQDILKPMQSDITELKEFQENKTQKLVESLNRVLGAIKADNEELKNLIQSKIS